MTRVQSHITQLVCSFWAAPISGTYSASLDWKVYPLNYNFPCMFVQLYQVKLPLSDLIDKLFIIRQVKQQGTIKKPLS